MQSIFKCVFGPRFFMIFDGFWLILGSKIESKSALFQSYLSTADRSSFHHFFDVFLLCFRDLFPDDFQRLGFAFLLLLQTSRYQFRLHIAVFSEDLQSLCFSIGWKKTRNFGTIFTRKTNREITIF